jgi:hypothetical protein
VVSNGFGKIRAGIGEKKKEEDQRSVFNLQISDQLIAFARARLGEGIGRNMMPVGRSALRGEGQPDSCGFRG